MAGRTLGWPASLLVLSFALCYVQALDNGLGLKPPMGFNTWNYFGCEVTESAVRMTADRLVSMGLAAAGYTYLNIDDCWQSPSRAPDGQLASDPVKFPSGMAALAAAVHAKGLKFWVYSDAGSNTCAGFPGSRHHESVDATTFAAWGVDFLKYDNCYAEDADIKQRYTDMRDALNKTGRSIHFSMCSWGRANTWEWARDIGNSWRTYGVSDSTRADREQCSGCSSSPFVIPVLVRQAWRRVGSGPARVPGGHSTRYAGHTYGTAGVTHPGAPASHASWRPWSDPEAAELQARLRAASQRRRHLEAVLGQILAFILAHKYLLASLSVVLLLGALTTCLAHWRLRVRARSRGRSSGGGVRRRRMVQ